MLKIFAIAISIVLLTACTSAPLEPEAYAGQFKDKFSTSIKGEGIKLFTYKAKVATASDRGIEDPLPHQQRIDRRRQNARSYAIEQEQRAERLELWGQQVEVGLQKTIDMTGYCKEGYMILNRSVSEGRGEIRGECNDGATAEDIEKFSRNF
ncbi:MULTISPECIES: hypothetical protein [Shewanella]|uniref:Lipoprotein n=1 Tax=Shewanella japonica TaxID=93973 RepID=A0ABN4YI18_9GAMM|nr:MULTISPECIES: hypothetical protein [Shewanella]ARD22809.1 hypothetical protein SJ2017_2519 [Shewanella japonica]KPZ67813.1 hypothetical protein AN944_03914 [Shewanella sp. P1-14-1]OBT11088.1 hypothetical protein A9267_00080 [Shewanella sp. UCD-FRSSP16_17]